MTGQLLGEQNWLLAVLGIAVALLLFGCGAAAPSVATDPQDTDVAVPLPASGEELFASKGCLVCHGADGVGSAIAPALAGHTGDQVRRQVRSPIGTMPRFDTAQISDGELEAIVQFVESLTPKNGHQEPSQITGQDAVAMHHWMAISALKADHIKEAEHHVQHAIEVIEDPVHKRQMEVVLEDLASADLHDAEHAIEGMLVGMAEPELRLTELHLQLAISAIGVGVRVEAEHHLQHYLGESTGSEQESGQAVLDTLAKDDLVSAQEMIVAILEGMPHQHHHH